MSTITGIIMRRGACNGALIRGDACLFVALLSAKVGRPYACRSRGLRTDAIARDSDTSVNSERGGSKLYKDADEAVADLESGSTILSAGFGLCGTAGEMISALSHEVRILMQQ